MHCMTALISCSTVRQSRQSVCVTVGLWSWFLCLHVVSSWRYQQSSTHLTTTATTSPETIWFELDLMNLLFFRFILSASQRKLSSLTDYLKRGFQERTKQKLDLFECSFYFKFLLSKIKVFSLY